MAGGLTIQDIPSKRPSLANTILCAANPEETPLLTRARKGQTVTQMEHSYFVEVKPTRKTGGATDGQDVTTYEGGGPRKQVQIRIQEFRRTFKVGQQSQDIVDDAAVPNQFAKLKIDYGKEALKDAESVMLSDLPSAADEGIEDRGSRMAGLGDRLSTTAQADMPIDALVRMPAGNVYSGAVASFAESNLITLLQNRWNLCGTTMEFFMLCGSLVQGQMDNFANYAANVSGFTTTLRDQQNANLTRTLKRGIRMYDSNFGSVETQLDFFLPNAKRAYGLDMDQFFLMPFGKLANFTPLPNVGGGPRGMIALTMGAKPGDVRGHIEVIGT